MNNPGKSFTDLFHRKWILIPFLIILILWSGWMIMLLTSPISFEKKGQVGDLFGGINALFTGLALAALAISIVLQKREVKYQKEEIDRSKKLAETQQELYNATLRQNAKIALITHYNKKLEVLENKLKKTRSPKLITEFEMIKDEFEELLNDLQFPEQLNKLDNDKS